MTDPQGDHEANGRSQTRASRVPRPLRIAGATVAVLTVLSLLAAALTSGGFRIVGALSDDESEEVPTSLQAGSESPTTVLEPGVTEGSPEPPTTVAVVEPTTTEAQPAADAVECGVYQGVVCEGLFTDEPKLAADRERIEGRVATVASEHDVEFALVVVNNSRGAVPNDFAIELGSDGALAIRRSGMVSWSWSRSTSSVSKSLRTRTWTSPVRFSRPRPGCTSRRRNGMPV